MASSDTITVVGSGIAGTEFCVFCANDEAICVFSEKDEAADMNDEAADFGSTGDFVGLFVVNLTGCGVGAGVGSGVGSGVSSTFELTKSEF